MASNTEGIEMQPTAGPTIVINNANTNTNTNENNNNNGNGKPKSQTSPFCNFVLGCCFPLVWILYFAQNWKKNEQDVRCWSSAGFVFFMFRLGIIVIGLIVVILYRVEVGVFGNGMTYSECLDDCRRRYSDSLSYASYESCRMRC